MHLDLKQFDYKDQCLPAVIFLHLSLVILPNICMQKTETNISIQAHAYFIQR